MNQSHHGFRENSDKPESTCWCRPYENLHGWLHRADPWDVYWSIGEQGPMDTRQLVREAWEMISAQLIDHLGITGHQ